MKYSKNHSIKAKIFFKNLTNYQTKKMTEEEFNEIENLSKGGPLQEYREKASFNWKKMKLFFEDLELIKYKVILFMTLSILVT